MIFRESAEAITMSNVGYLDIFLIELTDVLYYCKTNADIIYNNVNHLNNNKKRYLCAHNFYKRICVFDSE